LLRQRVSDPYGRPLWKEQIGLAAAAATKGFDLEAELDSLDEETQQEIEALRPTRWPLGPPATNHQS
jgi:hypothetical protein